MTPSMIPTQAPQDYPNFERFEVQRCIRVMYGNEAQYYPMDPRQVEAVFEIVRNETSLNAHPNLVLILLLRNHIEHALIDHFDGDIYLAVDSGEDSTGEVCMAQFAGEAWRVVGYVGTAPDQPFQLMTTDNMLAAQSICHGLQALLTPVRVVLGREGGEQQFIISNRPAELFIMDNPSTGPASEFKANAYMATCAPDAVATIWEQLPSPVKD